MAQKKGLMYRVLDEAGNKVGTPIKASAFYNKPTLKNLEIKFKQNEPLKQRFALHVKNGIDLAIIRKNTLENLSKTLRNDGISILVRQNDEGRIYGMTFIDHKNKCVFNGSDLGRQYSVKAILGRCQPQNKIAFKESPIVDQKLRIPIKNAFSGQSHLTGGEEDSVAFQKNERFELLENLLKPQLNQGSLAQELMEEQELDRKKKKRLHL